MSAGGETREMWSLSPRGLGSVLAEKWVVMRFRVMDGFNDFLGNRWCLEEGRAMGRKG